MRLILICFLVPIFQSFGQEIAAEDLILFLDFNNENHTDKSIFGHQVINHGTGFNTTFDDSGLALPGDGAYVEVPFSSTLSISEEVTTSFWYLHQDQENNGFYSLVEQSANEFEGHSRYGTWIFDKNKLLTCIEPDACPNGNVLCQRCVSGTISMEEGLWYHIASTYNGSELSIYVNGEISGSSQFSDPTGISIDPVSLTIGTDVFDPVPLYLKGVMDQIKIFRLALSAEQVQASYQEFNAASLPNYGPEASRIYPNPVDDFLHLREIDRLGKVRIFSAGGQLMISSQGSLRIDLTSLVPGLYYIDLNNTREKFIVR